MTIFCPLRRIFLAIASVCSLTLLGACGIEPGDTANAPDPFERTNRAIHGFNKGLDRNVLKPSSEVYVAVLPGPVRGGIANGANTLSQPLNFVNHVLQGDVEDAGATFMRFGMNVFFGAGVLDPAEDAGIFDRPTDFGETLAVWGIDSGPYVELPVFGPSTVRDAFGLAVDLAGDPVNFVIPGEFTGYLVAVEVAELLQTRSDFARVIEALLYESADSYNALRIAYLQNRASDLNDGALVLEDLEDPYAFE